MRVLTRRQLLLSLPALAAIPRTVSPQSSASPIRVRTLNHFGIAVSDPARTIDFYQGLFGMPIVMRQASTTILRVGAGPQFLAVAPVPPNTAPSITHYCLGVDGFNVEQVLATLQQHGVTKGDGGAPMKAAVSSRDGGTVELSFRDPDGIECQLQDASYCGGTGPLGNVCTSPPDAVKKGLLALKDLSHLTIFAPDPQRSNAFYQAVFGLPIRSYQGPTAPTLAVGTVGFLMFTGGGAPARGGTPPAPPRPATINHGCFSMDGFRPDEVMKALEAYGLKPREGATGAVGAMRHYISLRMENRGGAAGGTPELYFTDPDGLLMQLQDTTYCGGGGVLGDACTGR